MVHGREFYRFAERLTQNAAVLKLASFITAHNALGSLLSQGFIHEAGALQRVQMEACEDILFICSPLIGLKETELHGTFLEAFWEEEPEFTSLSEHQKNRHTVRRKSIWAYLGTIGM